MPEQLLEIGELRAERGIPAVPGGEARGGDVLDRALPGALECAEQVLGIAGPECLARFADEPGGRRVSRGDDRRGARRRFEGREPERLVRPGQRDAPGAGEAAGERCAIGEVGRETHTVADPELPGALTKHVLGRTGSNEPKRPRLGRSRGGVEQVAQPLLPGEAPGVQDMVAAGDLRAGAERRVKSEPERQGRIPAGIGGRIDDGHHSVDLEVGPAGATRWCSNAPVRAAKAAFASK